MKTFLPTSSQRQQNEPDTSVAVSTKETPDDSVVRLEMGGETLRRLFKDGQICASDVRCLDCVSKQCLWKLCLQLSKDY